MTLERFTEALECLEPVIEERTDFAPAYEHAAHCAFNSGDKAKGLRYAKEAPDAGHVRRAPGLGGRGVLVPQARVRPIFILSRGRGKSGRSPL